MKWVTIFSLVILLNFAESRILHKRDHDGHNEEHPTDLDLSMLLGNVYTKLGENFRYVAMIIFAQNLQLCPFEEQAQRVKYVTELAEICAKGALRGECGQTVMTVAMDEMCRRPENAEKYPWHEDCCGKARADRYACFTAHQLTDPNAVPAYKIPEASEICKSHSEDSIAFKLNYVHEVARRHLKMYPPALTSIAHNFDDIAEECCKDLEAASQCFSEKMPAHVTNLRLVSAIHKHNCYILNKFGERALKATKLIQICQKIPAASFKNIHEIVLGITHQHKTCCSGDMMGCMIERLELTTKTCKKKDEISVKLKECCDKEILDQTTCIVHMENDEKPADLSPQVREYIEDPNVCKHFADEGDAHLAKFTCDYAKRHPEFSTQLLLRISKGYQDLLTKSCAGENSHDSLVKGEDELKKEIESSVKLMKKTCDAFENLGPCLFENKMLMKYTKKMPQVTVESLIKITTGMASVGQKCCKVPQEKQMSCSDGGLALVIEEMCEKLPANFSNEKVAHCCSDSYGHQRSCFTSLGPDETYVPPKLSVDSFHFTDVLCDSLSSEALIYKQQAFLINLVKQKLDITEEELTKVNSEFGAMREHCCKADNHAECFTVEGPKLIEKCLVLLGIQAAVHVQVDV
ncbi:serum albumin-like [Lissotriton helveticus]